MQLCIPVQAPVSSPVANRSVEAISRGGAALCTSASAAWGRRDGDIRWRPHRRETRDAASWCPDRPPPLHASTPRGTAVPDRTCRTPAREGRLRRRAGPAPLGGALTQAPGAVEVSLAPARTHALRPVVSPAGWARLGAALEAGRAGLQGRTVWMVNSTAVGGGVAELLRALAALLARGRPGCALGGDPGPTGILQASRNGFTTCFTGIPATGASSGSGSAASTRPRWRRTPYRWSAGFVRATSWSSTTRRPRAWLRHSRQAARASSCRSHVGADHPNALVRAAWDFLRAIRRVTRTRSSSRAAPASRRGWAPPE